MGPCRVNDSCDSLLTRLPLTNSLNLRPLLLIAAAVIPAFNLTKPLHFGP